MCDGYIPDEWREADVDSELRPISRTLIISKVNDSFICKWIWDCIADKVNADQYGCMRMTGTMHPLINLVHNRSAATDKLGRFIRILPLDFKKAFDHVNHTIVIGKLFDLGVHGCLVRWVASFLTDRQQRMKIGDILSTWVAIKGGVSQVTKLAALLFLVMLNGFQTKLLMVKYVDDATVSEEDDIP